MQSTNHEIMTSLENSSVDIEKQYLVATEKKAKAEIFVPYAKHAKWKAGPPNSKQLGPPMKTSTAVGLLILVVLLIGTIIATVIYEMNCRGVVEVITDTNGETNEVMLKESFEWVNVEVRVYPQNISELVDVTSFEEEIDDADQPNGPTTEEFVNDWKALSNECGRPVLNIPTPTDGSNIINGDDVNDIRNWPWAAYLSVFSMFFCGAELITNQWAVTAAHCVKAYERIGIDITLGTRTMYDTLSPSFQTGVTAYPNPYYRDNGGNDYDIALLKLHRPVQISHYIRPVCLTSSSHETVTYRSGSCWVIGWGETQPRSMSEHRNLSGTTRILQEVLSPLISTQDCRNYYSYSTITDNMICTSTAKRSGSCQGDSGGPMMCKNDVGAWDLVGTTSWGFGCGDPRFPDVLSRTSRFRKWIKDTIDRNGGPTGSVSNV